MKRVLIYTASIFLILFVCCIGTVPIEIAGRLVFGWGNYLTKVLPGVTVNWGGVGMGVVCLVGTVALGHWFGRWLYRGISGGKQWRLRWTGMLVAVVMMLFVAGMAATGVVHQTGWLLWSGKPWVTHGRGRPAANRVKCASNMRQIGQAIELQAKAHEGRLPNSFVELLIEQDISSEVFTCPASDEVKAPGETNAEAAKVLLDPVERHCSFVYLGRGLSWPVGKDVPLVIEPLGNHPDEKEPGANVLFGDGRVEWCTEAEAREIYGRVRGVSTRPATTRAVGK